MNFSPKKKKDFEIQYRRRACGQKIPVQPSWYITENMFLQAGK
jgi:hypothetical protein